MTDIEQSQKEILLCLADLVSGLYTQQAAIAGLLARTLPGISEEEKKTLEDSAKRNFSIADGCESATKLIQKLYDE